MIALALVACAALFPLVVQGKVPAAVSRVLQYPPWEEARPAGSTSAGGPEASAPVREYFPWYVFMRETATRGDSLLWNPYERCGMPFLAMWRTRALSPFSLPFYLFPPHKGLQFSVLLKLLIGGWCAYFMARRLGCKEATAWLVGVSFQLGACIFLWWCWPLSDTIAWLPLLVLFGDRLRKGQRSYWPLGAIVVALMLLGGEPEAVFGAVLFIVLYVLLPLGQGVGARVGSLTILGVTVGVAISLVGVQVVPYIEFANRASSLCSEITGARIRVRDLVVCFFPHFFGAFRASLLEGAPEVHDQTLGLLHVGLVNVLLLPLWFSLRRFAPSSQRSRVEGLLLASAVLTATGVLVGPVLQEVAWLAWLGPGHLLVANGIAVALAGAVAAQEWVRLDAESCKTTLRRLLMGVPLLVVIAATLAWASRSEFRPGDSPFAVQAGVIGGISLAMLVLAVITLIYPSLRLAGYGLGLLTAINFLWAFHAASAGMGKEQFFPQTDFISSLQQESGRVSGSRELAYWPLAGNSVAQFYGAGRATLDRYQQFVQRLDQEPLLFRSTGSPKLLLTKSDIQGPFAGIRPMLHIEAVFDSGAVLCRDLVAKPRAYMSYSARPVEEFHPDALGADQPPLVEAPVTAPDTDDPQGRATIADGEQNDTIVIKVDQACRGVLVLTDAWYPGWRAAVDGAAADIFCVDGLFRGVEVPAGAHEVVFHFDPASVRLGLSVTCVATGITVLSMLWLVVRHVRRMLSNSRW